MRKALTTLAVTTAAFLAPLASSGTAFAADTAIALPQPGQSIQVTTVDVGALIARIGGGCTTTYVNNVLGTPIGGIVTINGLIVTVNGYAATAYTFTQYGNTFAYVWCVA